LWDLLEAQAGQNSSSSPCSFLSQLLHFCMVYLNQL
jgi:hypothetical protein